MKNLLTICSRASTRSLRKMHSIRSALRLALLSLTLTCAQVQATGFPTVDAAALTQRLLEYTQMLKDYENLVGQLEQLKNLKSQLRSTVSFKSFFDSLVAQVKCLPLPQEKLDEVWELANSGSGRAQIEARDSSSDYHSPGLLRTCRVQERYAELNSLCYEKVGLYYTQREETTEDLKKLRQASDRVYELVANARQSQNVADINEALYAINTSEVLLRLIRQRIEVRQYEYEQRLAANEARRQAAMLEMTRSPEHTELKQAVRLGSR